VLGNFSYYVTTRTGARSLRYLQSASDYKRVFGIFNKIFYDTTDFATTIDVLRKVLWTTVPHVSVTTVEMSDRSLKCDIFYNRSVML